MTRVPCAPLLLAALLVAGCGCGGEAPAPGEAPRRRKPPGAVQLSVRGPDFDDALSQLAPAFGFAYAAFRGDGALARLTDLDGISTSRTEAAPTSTLAAWLRALRTHAGGAPLFPGGAALVLGVAEDLSPEAEPALEFWLAAPSGPALTAALAASGRSGDRLPAQGLLPELFLAEQDGVLVLASRASWRTPAPAGPWFRGPREQAARNADAYAVLSPSRYASGPLLEIMRRRSPEEHALAQAWRGIAPHVLVSLESYRGGVRVELEAPLDAAHPETEGLLQLLQRGDPLQTPALAPAISPFFLAMRVPPERAALWLEEAAEGPEARPSSAFTEATSPTAEPDFGAMAAAGGAWLRGLVREGLREWGGPELALATLWEARVPEVGLLVQSRRPKHAALAVQRFHLGEVGRRLTFVDDTLSGVATRYTRLDGLEPELLEPAYAFAGPFLAICSRRKILAGLLDETAPKLDESRAFAALYPRLGGGMAVAAGMDPDVLPRLAALAHALEDGPKGEGGDPEAGTPGAEMDRFEAIAKGVEALALGVGIVEDGRLRVVLSVATLEASEPPPPAASTAHD